MLVLCFAHGRTYDDAARACTPGPEDDLPSHSTIARYYSRLREILVDEVSRITSGKDGQIGGKGMIVQVDEALVGRRKYNVGRVLSRDGSSG